MDWHESKETLAHVLVPTDEIVQLTAVPAVRLGRRAIRNRCDSRLGNHWNDFWLPPTFNNSSHAPNAVSADLEAQHSACQHVRMIAATSVQKAKQTTRTAAQTLWSVDKAFWLSIGRYDDHLFNHLNPIEITTLLDVVSMAMTFNLTKRTVRSTSTCCRSTQRLVAMEIKVSLVAAPFSHPNNVNENN